MDISRRKFVKQVTLATSSLPFLSASFAEIGLDREKDELEIHIFSKHLQFLGYREAGEVAAEMGFSGIDLTVRPKGHVLPETVSDDLPRAIREIKKGGSGCKMITTTIESVSNPLDRNIIETASQEGVQYYRANWYKYLPEISMNESMELYQDEVKKLGDFNEKHDIIGCYQNHAGTKVGASFWEVKKLLETANPAYFGTQYDIRHAVAEGGHSWENGLKLLKDHIKTIVLKDFIWGKVDGKWKPVNVPIGEGMVDFGKYFSLLKAYQIKVPVSLHLEYPLGGAEKGLSEISVDKKVVFDAMVRDMNALQTLWKEA